VDQRAAASAARFPCRVAPCGLPPQSLPLRWFRRPAGRACRCGEASGKALLGSRLSGPLLDRIDLQVVMRRLEADDGLLGRQPTVQPPPTTAPISKARNRHGGGSLGGRGPGKRMVERKPRRLAHNRRPKQVPTCEQPCRISTEGMESGAKRSGSGGSSAPGRASGLLPSPPRTIG